MVFCFSSGQRIRNNGYANMKNNIISHPSFFIIGTQRSGTTLLRLLLNNHSEVAIPTESTFLMPFLRKKFIFNLKHLSMYRKKTILQYLLTNSQFAKWDINESLLEEVKEKDMNLIQFISFLYSSFASKYGKSLCGDKTPPFIRKLPILIKAYPEAKFIHIVRDGRDTFLSLRKKSAPGASNVSLGAFEWKYKLTLINKALKGIENRLLEVRYEDLVNEPQQQLLNICEFLGVSYQEDMLDFWKESESFIAKHHSEKIFKPIDPSNIFKWKRELSDSESRKYAYFSKKTLQNYSYEIPTKPIKLKEKFTWWSELLFHVPKRLFRIIRIAFFMRVASKFGLRVGKAYYD